MNKKYEITLQKVVRLVAKDERQAREIVELTGQGFEIVAVRRMQ